MDEFEQLIDEVVAEESPIDVFRAAVDAVSEMAKMVDSN